VTRTRGVNTLYCFTAASLCDATVKNFMMNALKLIKGVYGESTPNPSGVSYQHEARLLIDMTHFCQISFIGQLHAHYNLYLTSRVTGILS
jgi:hypothetical protein